MKHVSWFHAEDVGLQSHAFCGGTVIGYSCKSPVKDSANEDAATIIELGDEHGLLVVSDGVGGANAGDAASRMVIESIVKNCENATPNQSVRSEVLDALEFANREVLSWGLGAGATAVIAEFLQGTLRVFHVGDSSALLCSNRGREKFSTVSHAPVAMAVELGVLSEDEALMHEDRNIISNCVGLPDMMIELGSQISMANRDTLLVGSDGLFDNLTTEEVVGFIRAGDLVVQSEKLLGEVQSRMNRIEQLPSKPDDLTMLVFRQ